MTMDQVLIVPRERTRKIAELYDAQAAPPSWAAEYDLWAEIQSIFPETLRPTARA